MKLYVIVALLSAVVATVAMQAQVTQLTGSQIDDAGYAFDFVEHVYRQDKDQTYFLYKVTANEGHFVNHWVVSTAAGCDHTSLTLSDNGQSWAYGQDAVTGLSGYKLLSPLAGSSSWFMLTFDGKVGAASGAFSIFGGVSSSGDEPAVHTYFKGVTTVPACDQGIDSFEEIQGAIESPITVECDSEILDDCDGDDDGCEDSEPYDILCANSYTISRTYTSGDGNTYIVKIVQIINVRDTTDPIFVSGPSDTAVSCEDADSIQPPSIDDVVFFDNCTSNLNVEVCEERTNGTCIGYYLTRTYTATDECGNSKCHTVVISVADNTPPVLDPKPNNTQYECLDLKDFPQQYPPLANVTASDNCDENVFQPTFSEVIVDGECRGAKYYIRQWGAEDECGLVDTHQQIISITDDIPPYFVVDGQPVLGGDLPIVEDECVESEPPFIYAFDECLEENITVPEPQETRQNLSLCNYIIRRTWTVCDDCNNTAVLRQQLNVRDDDAPVFNRTIPSRLDRTCKDNLTAPDEFATDNCLGVVPADVEETISNTSCPNVYNITRVYTVTDGCNEDSRTQLIVVTDDEATLIDDSSLPQLGELECDPSNIPNINDYLDDIRLITEDDDCDYDANITAEVPVEEGDNCNRTITWTFVSTDCSGNQDTAETSFSIVDTSDPELQNIPGPDSAYCALPPVSQAVTATDVCQGVIPVGPPEDIYQSETCPQSKVYHRTWTVDDGCGNTDSAFQVVSSFDNLPPVFDNDTLPGNLTVNCTELDGALAEEPAITAFDDCLDRNVDVNQIEEVLVYQDAACPANQIWRQTWEACDECNNCVNYTRWITSVDNTGPVISPKLPEGQREYNLSCDEPLVVPDLCVNDDCSNVTFEFSRVETPDPNCPQAKTVSLQWIAFDDCGNGDEYGLTINVYDNEGPSFANDTDDANVDCLDGLAAANALAATGLLAVDNCAPDELVYGELGQPIPVCTGVHIFPVVWTYSDECNEPISVTHYVNESDTTAPVIVYDGDIQEEFECQVVEPPFNFSVSDDCSGTDIDFLTSFDESNTERLTIIRTKLFDEAAFPDCESNYTDSYYLSAEDDCGNVGYYNFTLTARDTEAPVFDTTDHGDITVDCSSVPPMTAPPVSDACSEVEIIDSDETDDNNDLCANRTITRTWVARDACGHEATHTQVITVIDTTAPNVTYEFENGGSLNLTCVEPVPSPYDVCIADDCSNATLTLSIGSDGDDCYRTITWSWTAEDECGNAAEPLSFEINIRDDIAPEFNGDVQVNNPYDCEYELPPHPGCSDACSNVTVPNRIEGSPLNQVCDGSFDVPVAYSCADDCGNIAWQNVTLQIRDTVDPEFLTTPPAEETYDCEAGSFNPPTFDDDCSDVTISNTTTPDDLDDDCEYTSQTTYVWTITDDCGNNASFTRVETVGYNESRLRFNADPQDGSYDCLLWNTFNPDGVNPTNSFGVGVLTALDGCDNAADVNRSNPTIVPGCGPLTGTKTYVWTATDVCGYSINVDATATFTDTKAPFSNSANSSTVTNECEIQDINDPIANDDCDDTPSVTLVDTTVNQGNDECNYTFDVVREYELRDDCGNVAPFTHTQTYTWTPAASTPVFTLSPEQEQWLLEICETVGRNGNNVINFCEIKCQNFYGALEPNVTLLYDAVDRCDQPLDVEYDGTDNDEYICPNIRTEIYRFRTTDHCNVSASFVFTVEIIDTESPQVSPLDLPSINAECGDPSIPLPRVYATDNCPGVTLEFSSEDTDFDADDCCSFKRIRRWVARDACNITSNIVEQVISFRDTLPPNFTEPENYVIECPEPFPELEPPTAYEAPLALYHCVDLDNSAGSTECFDGTDAPLCGPDANTPAPAFSLSDPSDSSSSVGFQFVENSFVVKYAWGELLIEGLVESLDGSNTRFHLWLELSGRLQSSDVVNSGTVLDCLSDACSANVDKTVWTYYNSSRGYLLQDDGGSETNVVNVTLDHRSSPGYSQYGVGAIGVNVVQQQLAFFLTYNATGSGSLPASWNLPALGNADGRVVLENQGQGSCEVDLEDYPELICNRTLNVTQFKNVTVPGDCPGEYQVFIYYWAEDEAGNTAMTVQTVTVKDNTSPYFVSAPPLVVTDECEEPALIPPVVQDNCTEVSQYYNETEKEISPDCERNYEFQRQWYFYDACENPLTFVQTVVVNDNEPAELNGVPQQPLVYECDEEVILPNANATDNCVEFGPIVPVVTSNITDGDCPYAYTLTLTYTADDECNPADVETATVIVQDTTDPEWTNDGTSTNNSCVLLPHTPPSGDDNCGEATASAGAPVIEFTTPAECLFNRRWTYTYTLEDECGNVADDVRVVSEEIYDNTPPTWIEDSLPEDRNATCREEIVTPPNPNATDNCVDNPVTVELIGEETVPLPGACPSNYDIVYTWEACDSCDNCVTYSATVSVRDNDAPELCLSGTGGDLGECEKPSNSTEVYDCLTIPPPVSICAYDNCDNVTATFEARTEPADDTCDYQVIYSWTATDACGLTDDLVIVHRVVDDLAPQWDVVPQDRTLDCTSQEEPADPTFTEECNPGGPVTRTVDTSNSTCPLVKTFNYLVADACGNENTTSVTYTYVDDTDPFFVQFPADQLGLDCTEIADVVGAAVVITFDDDCHEVDLSPPVWNNQTNCPGNQTYQRTWTITDECGNDAERTQTLSFFDTTPPVVEDAADSRACNETELVPEDYMDFSDDCSSATPIFVDATIEGDDDECPSTYVKVSTYNVADECGNVAQWTFTENVTNPFDIVWDFIPENDVINCTDLEDYEPENATASHPCVDIIVVRSGPVESAVPGSDCPNDYRLTWTFTATDNCGHSDSVQYYVDVLDNTEPQWDENVPQGERLFCDFDNLPPAEPLDASDICGHNVTSTVVDVWNNASAPCNYSVTRTWTACDDCGNCIEEEAVYTLFNEFRPTLTITLDERFDDEVYYECTDCIPTIDDFTVVAADADNCYLSDVRPNTTTIPTDCPNVYTVVFEWCVDDGCYETCDSRTIYVNDTKTSFIDTSNIPNSTEYECLDWFGLVPQPILPPPDQVLPPVDPVNPPELVCAVSSHSGLNLQRDISPVDPNFLCGLQNVPPFSIIFPGIKVAGYNDGLKLSFITVNGLAPSWTEGLNDNQERVATLTGYASLVGRSAAAFFVSIKLSGYTTDAVEGSPHREFPAKCTETFEPNYHYFRTYDADSALIGVGEFAGITIPVIRKGPPAQCGIGGNNKNLAYGCSGWMLAGPIQYDSGVDQSLVYNADAGKHGDFNIDAACTEQTPPVDEVTGCTLCPDDFDLDIYNRTENGTCPQNFDYIVDYVWTDCSGNTFNLTRTFSVRDETDPVLVNLPANTSIPCTEDFPSLDNVGAYDLCECGSADNLCIDVVITNETIGQTCDGNYTVLFTFTACDSCDNCVSETRYVEVYDNEAPEFTSSPDPAVDIIECGEAPPQEDLTYSDNCSNVTYDKDIITVNGTCEANKNITYVWTLEDDCGNTAAEYQYIVLQDTLPPFEIPLPEFCINFDIEQLVIADASDAGVLFDAGDNCSTVVTIEVTGCYTSQDAYYGHDASVTGFTPHCFYDEANDQLKVVATLYYVDGEAPNDEIARFYYVSGIATDECGLTVDLNRTFYLPYPNSTLACSNNVQPCPGECPCEYNQPLCNEVPSDAEVSYELTINGDVTTVTYTISPAPSGIVSISSGLSGLEIVPSAASTADGLYVGEIQSSFIHGLHFLTPQNPGTYSFSVRGPISFEAGTVQISDSSSGDCSVVSADVPVCVAVDQDEPVHGKVGISGVLNGASDSDSILFGLEGVQVVLLNAGEQVVANTYTDANGDYSFGGPIPAGAKVALGRQGFLGGYTGQFIITPTFDLFNVYPYGLPVAASLSGATNFNLYIDEYELAHAYPDAYPSYRQTPGAIQFWGRSYPRFFWERELAIATGNRDGQTYFHSAASLAYASAARSLANAWGCSYADNSALAIALEDSDSSSEALFVSDLLNHAANSGLFAPYRDLEALILRFASVYVCGGSPAPAELHDMLTLLADAY